MIDILKFILLFVFNIYFINAQSNDLCKILPERPLGMTDKHNGIKDEQITSSSAFSEDTEAKYARLHYADAFLWDRNLPGSGAWVSKIQDSEQYVEVDLLKRKVVVAIGTQGRQGSREFVRDYYVQYSDTEGKDKIWTLYRDQYGKPFLFNGNVNGNDVKLNNLTVPIIARHIRIKPQRWNKVISLRFELFGCDYKPWIAHFDGKSRIDFRLDSEGRSIQTSSDRISFRFKTQNANGLIMHADGGQGDFLTIELYRTRLRIKINLGYSTKMAPEKMDNLLEAGSMLDDDLWHDVIIVRKEKDVNITLDRVKMWRNITADFIHLNLNRNVSIGGLSHFSGKSRMVSVMENFLGCMEEFIFNGVHVIRDSRRLLMMSTNSDTSWEKVLHYPEMSPMMWWGHLMTESEMGLANFATVGAVGSSCAATPGNMEVYMFPTIDNAGVYIRLEREGVTSLSFSLSFRTFSPTGTLFYYNVDAEHTKFIHLSLVKGLIAVDMVIDGVLPIEYTIENEKDSSNDGSKLFSDGIWHTVKLSLTENKLSVKVDDKLYQTIAYFTEKLSFQKIFYIGGGKPSTLSYQGCMKNIILNNAQVSYSSETFDATIQKGTCAIIDRCTPNPCKHQAPCSQNGKTFMCNCTLTGYKGEVCHQSRNPTSCSEVSLLSSGKTREEGVIIDLDGSGVLPPFKVNCDFSVPNIVMTEVEHNHEDEEVKVEGYYEPGSFRLPYIYGSATRGALNELTRRASECEQSIDYKCSGAKLLKTPPGGGTTRYNQAYGYWIGRRGQPLFYWGGGIPGRQLCSCGVKGSCSGNSLTCNCDGDDNSVYASKTDSGLFTDKNDLPVMEVRLGDTTYGVGAQTSSIRVGKLRCKGDSLFDNTVTFAKPDAIIHLPPIFSEDQFDMIFMFRTTVRNAVIIQSYSAKNQQFLEFRIREGNGLRVAFNVGHGVQILEVMSANWLDNNAWHIVRFERNRKQSVLIVDDNGEVTHHEDPDRPYVTFNFGADQLIVGGSQAFTDGYLGCFSNLIINGVVQNLKLAVERDKYGMRYGCKPRCDEKPCLNRGECFERYSHYICECGLTPYRGFICGREVGASFMDGAFIEIILDSQRDTVNTMEEYIEVGFKTKAKKGTLIRIEGEKDYFAIKINNQGGISMLFNLGFKRQEIPAAPNIDFTTDQHHTLRFWRSHFGRVFHIQVDDYAVYKRDFSDIISDNSDTRLDKPRKIFIGRKSVESTDEGFVGCLFRMQFNNIFPLKMAFNNEKKFNVVSRNIRENKCGFEEIMPRPDDPEIKRYPKVPELNRTESIQDWQRRSIIVGVVLAIIMIIVALLIYLFFRNFTVERGDYDTREAKGANEMDTADNAVRYGRTGQPDVTGKEWWI